MTFEIGLVFATLVAAIVLFATDRLRMDVVALMALLVLALTGVLTPSEALAGFADPVVIMIAGLFVVGDGLFQTGVAERIGRLPARLAGDSQVRLIIAVMVIVAMLSGFMSSTGTVAVMLPAVMGLAWQRGISPSRLLIPLATGSLLGGMLTMIGTPPNLIVSAQLESAGREPFGFFTFTPVGLVMLVVGVGFMALFGRKLLPDRKGPARADRASTSLAELADTYGLPETLHRVRIPDTSHLAGVTLGNAAIRSRHGVTIVDIRSRGSESARSGPRSEADPLEARPVMPDTPLGAGDLLWVQATPERAAAFTEAEGLELIAPESGKDLLPPDIGLVEVLLTPRSRLIGQSLSQVGFRSKYRVTVLGVRRLGEPIRDDVSTTTLRFGDTLLVKGPWRNIRLLRNEHRDFVVAGEPRELADALRPLDKSPVALTVALGMMVLMTLGITAPVVAVMLAAVLMVLTGCVGTEDAYRSVNWESVVLIAAVLPMATALQKTGAMSLLVDALGGTLDGRGPVIMLAVLFILTSALSQVISNTATAVLLAPLGYQLATGAGLAPEPFMMGIAVAASTAFATPVASPVNVLVLGPGGYRFGDFFRVGVALQILILAATLLVVPLLFPFNPAP